jgi:transposase-like protein
MRNLSDTKIDAIYEAIVAGCSVAEVARRAGVAEKTARSYRHIFEQHAPEHLPKLCGCGRYLKHLGNCAWRRARRLTPPVA